MTIYYKNVYLKDNFVLLGRNEYNVNIKADKKIDSYYNKMKSIEEAEVSYVKESIQGLLDKNKLKKEEIDLCINSDLQSQNIPSNYSVANLNLHLLTTYSACASFVSNTIVASLLIDKGLNNIINTVSSHNLVCEKQFRFPIEYGSIKKKVNTFTMTGSVSTLITNAKSKVMIESSTIGSVIDYSFKDANNFGAIMAPSAAKTIYEHLVDTKRKIDYYDIVLTGDLGIYGLNILKELLKEEYGIIANNIKDASSMLINDSKVAGGSGPTCLPFILFKNILQKDYKKILIVGTGSLHSKMSSNLKMGFPSISHAVSLKVVK